MKQDHALELEQFQTLLSDKGIGRFHLREKIFEAFLKTENHLSLNGLTELIAESKLQVSNELIEDTMNLLIKYGFAEEIKFDNRESVFEHRHPGKHHDHMVCTGCGQILEFENDDLEKLQMIIARNHEFQILRHRMEIYGLCRDCSSTVNEEKTLLMARPGQRFCITDIYGGQNVKMRLRTMGLNKGVTIEVVNSFGGQIIVAVNDTRMSLGKGLAGKIIIRRIAAV